MNLLVTGFGPFLSVKDNPSSSLARACGRDYRILEVAYDAVDEFLADPKLLVYDGLFLMGVARRPHVSLEVQARNAASNTPDVHGVIRTPNDLDQSLPSEIKGTLWTEEIILTASGDLLPSQDAGNYLCNYIYYEALRRLPSLRVGFLHVAPFDEVSEQRQLVIVRGLLRQLSLHKEPTLSL